MTEQPQQPSFVRSMGTLWLYTVLRALVFLLLWGLLWLFGLGGFLGAIIALVLSLPLSYVLLARPRAKLAETIEQRINAQRARKAALDERLDGDD
jgi:fatty acid desaturase